MQHIELKGQTRQVGNKAVIKAFRKQGDLKSVTNTPKSHIIDLNLDGKMYQAVLHELQWHPVTDECLHVDFLAVNEKKPVAIAVPIIITGHSKGVQQGGKFSQLLRSIRVSGLLSKLPDDVTVDISDLGLDKAIKAGDVKVDGISVLTDKDAIISPSRQPAHLQRQPRQLSNSQA